MNDCLYHLCRHCVGIMDGWFPLPAWVIAKKCGVSVSTARRRLRKLKKDGYVETIAYYFGEQEESRLPYNGWTITEKAKKTEEYQTAWEKEREICREIFGTDMFPDE